jgi:hypothetical protein
MWRKGNFYKNKFNNKKRFKNIFKKINLKKEKGIFSKIYHAQNFVLLQNLKNIKKIFCSPNSENSFFFKWYKIIINCKIIN